MYRQLELKPDFSEIGRRYGLDRHTVARYWNEGGDVDDGRRNRPSGFDAHSALIAEKAAMPGATKKAVHEYLLHRCGGAADPGYNAFTHYCRRHDIAFDGGGRPEPHPRYDVFRQDYVSVKSKTSFTKRSATFQNTAKVPAEAPSPASSRRASARASSCSSPFRTSPASHGGLSGPSWPSPYRRR